jgi:hypothetical protein
MSQPSFGCEQQENAPSVFIAALKAHRKKKFKIHHLLLKLGFF